MMRSTLIAVAILGLVSSAPVGADDLSPKEVAGATTIDITRAKALFNDGVPFIDVRTDADWDAGRIPGAKHIELKKQFTEEAMAKVADKEKEVVFYCNGETCHRSSEACVLAVSWGFRRVYYFRDGFPAWKLAGHPLE